MNVIYSCGLMQVVVGCGLSSTANRYSNVILNYGKGAGSALYVLKSSCSITGIQSSGSTCSPDFGSYYYVDSNANWERVTVVIPSTAISRSFVVYLLVFSVI